jgi:hypothetical protein
MDIEIKKSTIPELDQTFVDEILREMPKNEESTDYTQSKWLRDSGGTELHKLEVIQAATLKDSLAEANFASMDETVERILKKRVKKDSYFKVKSGPLISIKVDNDNAKEVDSIAKDSLMPEALALAPIVVSNRTLTAKEIMARVLEKTPNNMDFGLSSSEVYVVSKNNSVIQKMDIEIKKSTIPELDQTFVDEILREMPKNEESMHRCLAMM